MHQKGGEYTGQKRKAESAKISGALCSMEEDRKQRIAELKERIFLLQVEERRFGALLSRPIRGDELKAKTSKDLKKIREMLSTLTKELTEIDEWSRR